VQHESLTQFRAQHEAADDVDLLSPPDRPPSRSNEHPWLRSRAIRSLIAVGAGVVLLIIFATTALVLDFRARTLADAERELTNTALILAEHSDRTFQSLDVVLMSIVERLNAMGVGSSEEYTRLMADESVHLMLKDKIAGLPQFGAVSLIGLDGRLINFSRSWPSPTVDVSDRDYFRALWLNPGLTSFVSEPALNRVTGRWSIFLARRFTSADGRFLGLVLGTMELRQFEASFGTVALGENGAISLQRSDGTMLARYPRAEASIGNRYTAGPDALEGRAGATLRVVGRVGERERLIAYRRLASYPLFVSVGNDVEAILSAWRRLATILLGAGALVALIIGATVFLVSRRLVRNIIKSRKTLHDQKLQLDTALNNMTQGLLMFDPDGRVMLCNKRYMEMYRVPADMVARGCTRSELIAHHYAIGLLTGDPDRRVAAAMRDAANCQAYTRLLETTDGRFIAVTNRRVGDGLRVSTHEDVTEFRQREASFRMLFESNPLPMFAYDQETFAFINVNAAAVAQFGYTREQFLALTVRDVWAPADRDRYSRMVRRPDDYHGEEMWNYCRADGSEFEAAVYSRALRYRGRMTRFGAMVDMTERRIAERERDRNREFLDSVIESVPTTIFVKDIRDHRYVLINQAAERLWGLPRGEVIGKRADELFPKETADIIMQHDRELIESRSQRSFPAHAIHTPRNGVRLVTSHRLCMRDQHGEPQYLIGVLEDVTDRMGVEDQLRQAQKMESVGNLTGGLAHDFNNLLTIIIGNLDLLQDDVAGNAGVEEKLGIVMQAAERGADLTRQMLAFSRRQSLQPTRVDTNALIVATSRLLARTLGEAVKVDLELGSDLRMAIVDEAQLETALVNIAINARDAMPRGGTLTIATRNSELSPAYAARHAGLAAGDYVTIELTDTGTGMSPDVLDRVFEPFFTTKPVGKGTGLGLSMVYGFMKQSGGHVTALSEPGRGTTFRLFLPVVAVAQSEAGAPLSRSNAADAPESDRPIRVGTGEVILAVDDNAEVRGTVALQLKKLGYEVREAENAHTALAILESDEQVDLLFTDIVMPGGVNGKELAARARLKRPNLKVLFTSGFPGTANSITTELDEDDVLLSKPYRHHDLAGVLHEMLGEAA
jgi:PAS domain S-box-containing protein